jgi:hypothetical protein
MCGVFYATPMAITMSKQYYLVVDLKRTFGYGFYYFINMVIEPTTWF